MTKTKYTHQTPDKAFILAAGFGRRLRPYTEDCPKPLIKIGGRTMLDLALDRLVEAGVRDVVINTHYKAEMIEQHVQTRDDVNITLSFEPDLLDTGGGIKNALAEFGDDPFYVVSGDGPWEDKKGQNALLSLAAGWNPDKMDILILLQSVKDMVLTHGVGDYDLADNGQAIRSLTQEGEYMWTSVRIISPQIFNDCPSGHFSFLPLMDAAEKAGRLYGQKHCGTWHHISTAEDLARVNTALAQQQKIKKANAA